MRIRVVVLLIVAIVSAVGCRKKTHVAQMPQAPKPTTAQPPRIGASETGIASWYGYPYHGRRAANGEIYDMEKMTAAHRTLPFNTWVRVRNLTNEKSCEVRITDRGPFVDGRVIDISKAAARSIDMLGPGTARVEVIIIAPPQGTEPLELFSVQVGAFRDHERAERVRAEMETRYGKARIVERYATTPYWRVLVGEVDSQQSAANLSARIAADGTPAFVVRLDVPDESEPRP